MYVLFPPPLVEQAKSLKGLKLGALTADRQPSVAQNEFLVMSIQAQAAAALDVACGDELTVDGCVARASPAHPSPRLCAQPTHVRDPVLTAQLRSASCDSLTAPTRPLTLNVTDALLPELCELRWCVAPCAPRPAQLVPHASACVSAFGLL